MKTEKSKLSESLKSEQENQNNVELNSNNEIIDIKGTPFRAVKMKEVWWIVLGNQAISNKTFKDPKKLIQFVNTKPWELMLTAAHIIANNIIRLKLSENENKEKNFI